MKKTANALTKAVKYLSLVLLVVFMASCTKDPGVKPNPTPPNNGGGNEQPALSTNMKNISSLGWVTDSIVSVWPNGARVVGGDCNRYEYTTMSTAQNGKVTIGECNPNPGNQYTFSWSFKDEEKKIDIGNNNNVWTIVQLDANRFVYYQDKPELFNPNVIVRTTTYARH